jgi:hypothetical protein
MEQVKQTSNYVRANTQAARNLLVLVQVIGANQSDKPPFRVPLVQELCAWGLGRFGRNFEGSYARDQDGGIDNNLRRSPPASGRQR